jgi:hypothetical protein
MACHRYVQNGFLVHTNCKRCNSKIKYGTDVATFRMIDQRFTVWLCLFQSISGQTSLTLFIQDHPATENCMDPQLCLLAPYLLLRVKITPRVRAEQDCRTISSWQWSLESIIPSPSPTCPRCIPFQATDRTRNTRRSVYNVPGSLLVVTHGRPCVIPFGNVSLLNLT